jgi:hypothetical protein
MLASHVMRHSGPAMTLGNMRANGVRELFVYCLACHRQANLNVDDYSDNIPVPAFAPRMRCGRCGHAGADVRPNWSERQAIGAFNGR